MGPLFRIRLSALSCARPGALLGLAFYSAGCNRLSLHNTGEEPVADVVVAFSLNPAVYRVRQPLLKLPALVPGVPVQLDGTTALA